MNKYIHIIFLFSFLLNIFFSCAPIQQTTKSLKPPDNWPMISKTESDFRKYFDENFSNLDPIEGIWNLSQKQKHRLVNTGNIHNLSQENVYRIAIIKDNSFENYDYTAVVLESKQQAWKPGRIKGYFRKTSYQTVYEGLWFGANYQELKDNYYFNENGLIESSRTVNIFDRNAGPVEVTFNAFLIRAYPYLGPKAASKTDNDTFATGTGFLLGSSGLIVTNSQQRSESVLFLAA